MSKFLKRSSLFLFAGILFVVTASVAFAADGDVTSVTLNDANNNGKIENVDVIVEYANAGHGDADCAAVSFATTEAAAIEKITVATVDAGAAITVSSVTWVSAPTSATCKIRFTLSEADGDLSVDTSIGLNVIYSVIDNTIRIQDAGANAVNVAAWNGAETDGAKPIITSIVMSQGSDGYNATDFTFSEPMFIDNTNQDGAIDAGDTTSSESIASAAAFGNIDAAGSIEALGNFAVTGNVDESGDAVDYWTASADGKTFTWKLAYSTASYLASASTTAPSGAFTPDGDLLADYFLAQTPASTLATQIVNNAVTPSPSGSWDLVKPILTTATVADAVGNNGKLDRATLVFNTPVRDSSIVDANATLGGAAGTFTTGDANDVTTVFNLTDANALAVDTSATGLPASFLYSNLASKFITDLAGNLLDTTTDGYIVAADAVEVDGASPIITAIAISKSGNQNLITVSYSEAMTYNTNGWNTYASGTKASDEDFGEMTVAGTIDGIGAWAGGTVGNIINHAVTDNSLSFDENSKILTITLNGQPSGVFVPTSDTVPVGNNTFTPEVNDAVLKDQGAGLAVNRFGTVASAPTVSSAWDVTPPNAGVTGLATGTTGATYIPLSWTAISAMVEFGKFVVFYGGTGVTYATGTPWTSANDSALTTSSTTQTTVTGIAPGSRCFFVIYVADIAGNLSAISSQVTEIAYLKPVGGSSNNLASTTTDSFPPAAPSQPKAEYKDGKVVLTWTDPMVSDFASVGILKGTNESPSLTGTPISTVNKGTQTYTDTDFKAGDTLKYILFAKDTSSNKSENTEVLVVVIPKSIEQPSIDQPTDTNVEQPQVVDPNVKIQANIVKKIEKLNITIEKYKKSIEKYQAKIAKLDNTKKADKKKITSYNKSIKNWNKLIRTKQVEISKLQRKLTK